MAGRVLISIPAVPTHPTQLPANPHRRQGHWCSQCRPVQLPQHPPALWPAPGPGLKVTALHGGGSAESRIPLRLSSAPKPPAMIIGGLLSLLLLLTGASGTPIGDQDEDIQVQENFEADRVMAACGPFILGRKGWGKLSFIFLPREGQ